MRRVRYTGKDGRVWVAAVPDGMADTEAESFPIIGPPDLMPALTRAGWTKRHIVTLHNELAAMGALTTPDVRQPGAVQNIAAAIQRSLRMDVQSVVDGYLAADTDGESTEGHPDEPGRHR